MWEFLESWWHAAVDCQTVCCSMHGHFLASRKVSDRTRELQYLPEVSRFLLWCQAGGRGGSDEELDLALSDYFDFLYLSGTGGKAAAGWCLSGLVLLRPALRLKLPTARAALKGFERLRPAKSWPPLSWESCVLAAMWAALVCSDANVGLAFLVQFHCLLRTSELLGLRVRDIVFSARDGLAALHLKWTKTGPHKWVKVLDPELVQLLRSAIQGLRRDDMVFAFTPRAYRSAFARIKEDLGFDPRTVPHSLRHGGAVYYWTLGRQPEWIRVRGRWASVKSVITYLQVGRALLINAHEPAWVQRLGARAAESKVFYYSLVLARRVNARS